MPPVSSTVVRWLVAAALATTPAVSRAASWPLPERCESSTTIGLSGQSFAWPDWAPAADGAGTVLLGVGVRSRRAAPELVVRAGGRTIRQTLEPDARGTAWIDVSPLADLPAGVEVQIGATRARFEPGGRAPGEVTLCGFSHPPITEDTRVLVLAPHPDDAEIAAFGLYASTDADVVTVTAGDAGGFNYRELVGDRPDHYLLKGEVRTWDSIVVPQLGGVPPGRARNLGYSDAVVWKLWVDRPNVVEPPIAQLPSPDHFRRINPPGPLDDRPYEHTWAGLVTDLEAELRSVQPEVIATPHPLLDGHGDHQFTTVALVEALDRLEDSYQPRLWLYTNHMADAEPWPFGPREHSIGMPPPAATVGDVGDVEFDALRSLPLRDETIVRKILALEMMHDLRPLDLQEPLRVGQAWKRTLRLTGRSIGRAFGRRGRPSYSYLRRGPRPNEFYWVLDRDGAVGMVERFLELRLEAARSRTD